MAATCYSTSKYTNQNSLKQQNDILLSKLNLGVKNLKQMVATSNSSINTCESRSGPEITHGKSRIRISQDIDKGKENARRSRKILKPSRASSTPKQTSKRSSISGGAKMITPQNSHHSALLVDTGNLKPTPNKLKKMSPDVTNAKPILVSTRRRSSKTPRKSNRVSFSQTINKKHVVVEKENFDTSMMGRDWIASMLENDALDKDRPDKFFKELNEFRKTNWSECKSTSAGESSICQAPLPPTPAVTENLPLCCTGNGAYMLNNRLNPVPIHGPFSRCPTCKGKPRSLYDDDGYVRVSIPRSTVKSPYRLRPHRQKSFEPSDSVALSMHCLAGWEAAKPSCIPGPTNIDLASNVAKPGLTSLRSWRGGG